MNDEERYEPIYTMGVRTAVAILDKKTGKVKVIDKEGMKKLKENMKFIKGLFER